MANRKVVVKNPVKSIVTTFKPSSLCVFSLGLEDRLVGIDTSSKRDRLHQGIFPGISALPGVGAKSIGINFETLVALKPDLVILYSQKDGLSLAGRLEKMGIQSIVIFPETFETIKASMRLIATAAGVLSRMEGIENQMDNMLSLVARRLSGLSDKEKKTAYFASSQGLFSTTTSNMLQHEIITRAGVINVSSGLTGYFQDISPEQLVKWNPDIMILSQHMAKSETKRLSGRSLMPVTAVSRKNVYRCPSDLAPWDFPSPLSVLATLWVAEIAYPDRFSDIDVRKTANTFHHTLFGKTMEQMGGSISDIIEW